MLSVVSGRISLRKINSSLANIYSSLSPLDSSKPSSIAITFLSGPRYESNDQSGMSHLIRMSTNLSTENYSKFGLQANLQAIGSVLDVIQEKNKTIISLNSNPEYIEKSLGVLSEIIAKPCHEIYEIRDILNNSIPDDDTPYHLSKSDVILSELIHNASFGYSGLGRSSFFNMNPNLRSQHLKDYYYNNFLRSYCSIVSSNIDDPALTKFGDFISGSLITDNSAPMNSDTITKNIFREGGSAIHYQESCPSLHLSYNFCFEPSHPYQSYLASELLKSYFGNIFSSFNYSTDVSLRNGCLFTAISKNIASYPRVKVTPAIFHYSDKILLSLKIDLANASQVENIIKNFKLYVPSVPNSLNDAELKKCFKRFVSEKMKSIEDSQGFCEFFSLLDNDNKQIFSKEFKLDNELKSEVNKMLAVLKTQKPSFAAYGDCRHLPNDF